MRRHNGWLAVVAANAILGLLVLAGPLAAQAPQFPARPAPPSQGTPSGPVQVQTPDWLPLSPGEQEYLDEILKYWEFRSAQIKRYRCQFKRWEYDPVFGPKHTFNVYSEGVIQYAAPDKGMFKVEKLLHYTPPEKPGEKPNYNERPDAHGEHWVCDGKSIFEFDYGKKQLTERQLPPHLQGQAISDGPLPFLFGAEAEKIKQRYWVRVITPSDVKGEYWLEAYPKSQQDAANFKMVHVIIDEKDYLPKGIIIFDRNFDERAKPARTTFAFENRDMNWKVLVPLKLNPFHREFYEPQTPGDGWKKVVERFEQLPPANGALPAGNEPINQARRPRGGLPPR